MFEELVSELVELTDVELDEFVREQELARRAAEAKLAAAIAVAEARALPEGDGHRSMTGYLKATCDWADGECARFRSASRLVDAHPEVGDAWLAGRFGSSQVAELSKARSHRTAGERFGEFVSTLVEQAESLRLPDFKRVVERLIFLSDADGTFDERAAIERRSATAVDAAGELHLRASGGDATSAAEFTAILRRFEQAEFEADMAARDAAVAAGDDVEPFRSGPQRRFDALLAMARAAASNEGMVDRARPLVSVLVDERTMSWVLLHSGLGAATDLHGDSVDPFTGLPLAPGALDDLLGDPETFLDRRCETTTGVPLRATDVLRALLSGEIRRVVLGAKGRVVDMGRSSRLFTGAARDAARLLTVACDHPGCDMPAEWCQIDHSTEWHDEGLTDQDNAGVDCAHHNRDKHRRRRRTRRAANGRVFTFRSDGTIILPVGVRPPSFGDDPPERDPEDEWDPDDPEFCEAEERLHAQATQAIVYRLDAAR